MSFKYLRQAVAAVVVVATFVLSSVFTASPAMAADTTIQMGAGGLAFSPNAVTASVGDTITFEFVGLGPHNVVFTDKSADAKALGAALKSTSKMSMKKGDDITLTIPDVAPGTYGFACTPHRGAGMIGKLTVE